MSLRPECPRCPQSLQEHRRRSGGARPTRTGAAVAGRGDRLRVLRGVPRSRRAARHLAALAPAAGLAGDRLRRRPRRRRRAAEARAAVVGVVGASEAEGVVELTLVPRSPGSVSARGWPASSRRTRDGRPGSGHRCSRSGWTATPYRCGRYLPDDEPLLDRAVLAGEAAGRWLWLVVRPASAVLLLPDLPELLDVSGLGPSWWRCRSASCRPPGDARRTPSGRPGRATSLGGCASTSTPTPTARTGPSAARAGARGRGGGSRRARADRPRHRRGLGRGAGRGGGPGVALVEGMEISCRTPGAPPPARLPARPGPPAAGGGARRGPRRRDQRMPAHLAKLQELGYPHQRGGGGGAVSRRRRPRAPARRRRAGRPRVVATGTRPSTGSSRPAVRRTSPATRPTWST